MGKRFTLHEAVRVDRSGAEEKLAFTSGVNLLVGMPNTGKTQWLRMLDFILGDTGKAEEAFDDQLAAKYVELRVVATIGDRQSTLVRRWHDAKMKTKIIIDDTAMAVEEFNEQLLERLGITPVKYPQGDAHGPRTWPTLGWRSLLRHIYRRQDSWSDIATRQYESEQHAALLQFLGAAEKIFVAQYRELVDQQNEVMALRAQKDQFQNALNMVTRELLNESEALSLTDDVINTRVADLRKAESEIEAQRAAFIDSLRAQVTPKREDEAALAREAAELRKRRDEISAARTDARVHLAEMHELREKLVSEADRLERAKLAGTIFGRLKVTHCPACDQPIELESAPGVCYVCHRHTEPYVVRDAKRRFAAEQRHIEGELEEADQVIKETSALHAELTRDLRAVNTRLSEVEEALAPARAQLAEILPPEIREMDERIGVVRERIRQMDGFRAALTKRQELTTRVDELEAEISKLERKVQESREQADLEQLGDDFADRINNYLTQLRQVNPNSWTQNHVTVELQKRETKIRIGSRAWHKKLGGTMQLYFLLAYNYALLSLYPEEWARYPGLAIIDVPAKLEDGSATADKENFVLEPYLALLKREEMKDAQLIVTGSSFENFPAHRIELKHVWT